jgi:hypothetical protein
MDIHDALMTSPRAANTAKNCTPDIRAVAPALAPKVWSSRGK